MSVSIISTGDPEKDAENLLRAEGFSERIERGICPNGCAELEFETPFSGNCPACGFHLGTNTPYGRRAQNENIN